MSKFENNAITWFEVPTTDIERATTFYETILDMKLLAWPGPEPCQMFPMQPGGVGGCLVQRAQQRPASDGALVYLNVDGKLDATLKRAEKAGVKVLVPRTEIPGGYGYYAQMQDSEGNHIGLHSRLF
ncbi:VOC family protein [Granulicella paludicola]|uniref:VOC family protein n=1 Tax=Granulicella paludicola TaxID=474951 RepID=UPI0021E0BF03|nr:VOC family protein [Granulicella paludicola]